MRPRRAVFAAGVALVLLAGCVATARQSAIRYGALVARSAEAAAQSIERAHRVGALTDADYQVARATYDRLREVQRRYRLLLLDWPAMGTPQNLDEYQRELDRLLAALQKIALEGRRQNGSTTRPAVGG